MLKEVIVTKIESPMRFDRYLRILDDSLTQGVIERALRVGAIKLNGIKATSNIRIKNGDVITMKNFVINESQNQNKSFSQNVVSLAEKILGEYLIEDNEHFFAINKPSCLASQGGSKIDISIDHALQYLNSKGGEFRIIHRLDLETSGVLLIAKSRNAATLLGNALQNRLCRKLYLAWVDGNVHDDSGSITSYLMKAQDIMKQVQEGEGKIAITDYKVLKRVNSKTMLEFTPHTGRTHQLRCHAAMNLKCPIIGDKKYGHNTSAPHLMLHACEFFIPASVLGVEYRVNAQIPEYFNLVV